MSRKSERKSGSIERAYARVRASLARRSRYLDPNVPVPSGKVHGEGRHVAEDEARRIKQLRERDPKTFTWRRLGLAFGVTDTQAWRVYHLYAVGTYDLDEVVEARREDSAGLPA
jgi:hypothetical protein